MNYSKNYILILFAILMLIGLAVPILSFFFDEDIDGCSNSSKGLKKNIDLNIKLTDEVGSDIIFKDLVKELNLVYFGYSFCPDICPIDLGRNVEVNYALNKNNKQFATFFVTVDPLRDTPERLREYTDLLDDSLVGLTGSIKQIEIAKKNFMVYGSKSSSDQNYLVDHSTFTYLINRNGDLLRHFTRQDTPTYIIETIECLIETAENRNSLLQE